MFLFNIKSVLLFSLILSLSVNKIYGQQEEDEEEEEEDTDDSDGDDNDGDDEESDADEDSDPPESATTEMTTTTTTMTSKSKSSKRRTKSSSTTTSTTTSTTSKPIRDTNQRNNKKDSKQNTKENEAKKIKESESDDYSEDEDQDYEEEDINDNDYYEEMTSEDLLKSLFQRTFSLNDIDLSALKNRSADQKWIELVGRVDTNLQSLMRAITPTALDVFYSVPELSASCSNSLLRIATGVQQLQEWAAKSQ